MSEHYLQVMGAFTCAFGGGLVIGKLLIWMLDGWWSLFKICKEIPRLIKKTNAIIAANQAAQEKLDVCSKS